MPKVEMAPPAVPAVAVTEAAVPKAPKPVGPHGQHDPHSTLDPERLIKVALQHESEGRLELALKTLADGIDKFPGFSRAVCGACEPAPADAAGQCRAE